MTTNPTTKKAESDHRETNSDSADPVAAAGPEKINSPICFATFLDILGFRSKASRPNLQELADELKFFRESCQRQNSPLQNSGTVDAHTEFVADGASRVRAAPTKDATLSFIHELMQNARIVIDCVKEGFLLRGSMDVGPMHLKADEPLFGPAAINAYDDERKNARFPRLIVTSEALQYFESATEKEYATALAELDKLAKVNQNAPKDAKGQVARSMRDMFFAHDSDGRYYLDYLFLAKHGLTAHSSGSRSWQEWVDLLKSQQKIYDSISVLSQGLELREKFSWLQKYHNLSIQKVQENPEEMESFSKAMNVGNYDLEPLKIYW